MTKIKICGLTSPKEADYLSAHQVDMAGFVLFFPKSKRNNTLSQVLPIMDRLGPSIKKVAVVVSPTVEQIQQIEALPFDYIQIHKELSDSVLSHCSLPILKAFNVKDMDSYEKFHNCPQVAGYVFDATEPGSGKTFDWNLVSALPRDEKMLILAGGLTPDNVSKAIAAVHPDGVDVSSGVEFFQEKGKDPARIAHFVEEVRKTSPLSS